jgi:hypothetical protein
MFGFVSRRRYESARATADRLREQLDEARTERNAFRVASEFASRRLVEEDAANRRLQGRVVELGRRIAALSESDPEHLAAMERELSAAREEAAVEKRRADRLQERLDDAVGLNDPKVLAGPCWRTGTDAAKGGLL